MDTKAIHPLDIHANSILATVYDHPRQVLADAILDPVQKRCILAAWASDAFAVEDKPWLRKLPGSPAPILLSEILDALCSLDDDDGDPPPTGHAAFPPSRPTFKQFDGVSTVLSMPERDRSRLARPHVAVFNSGFQARCDCGAQQQMVEPDAGIAGPSVTCSKLNGCLPLAPASEKREDAASDALTLFLKNCAREQKRRSWTMHSRYLAFEKFF